MSKIEEFRSFMHEINVDAFMLHTKDEYLNEYSEELTKLCGFTGTNRLLIVTKDNKCPFLRMDAISHKLAISSIGAISKNIIYKKRIHANG